MSILNVVVPRKHFTEVKSGKKGNGNYDYHLKYE